MRQQTNVVFIRQVGAVQAACKLIGDGRSPGLIREAASAVANMVYKNQTNQLNASSGGRVVEPLCKILKWSKDEGVLGAVAGCIKNMVWANSENQCRLKAVGW